MEFKATDSGDPIFLRALQSHCPAKLVLKLKIGAQVSQNNEKYFDVPV